MFKIKKTKNKKKHNPTFIFMGLCPFVILSVLKWCPFCNFKTVKDIFMNLGKNIKSCQTMCRKTRIFMELIPFVNFLCPLNNRKMLSRFFPQTWYKYKTSSDEVQRTCTITPYTFFYGICPIVFPETWYMQHTCIVKRYTENKNCYSVYI